MFIVLVGSPLSGFGIFGAFASKSEAESAGCRAATSVRKSTFHDGCHKANYFVLPLHMPQIIRGRQAYSNPEVPWRPSEEWRQLIEAGSKKIFVCFDGNIQDDFTFFGPFHSGFQAKRYLVEELNFDPASAGLCTCVLQNLDECNRRLNGDNRTRSTRCTTA